MKKFLSLIFLSLFLSIRITYAQTIVSAPYYPMLSWDTSPYKSFKVTGGTARPEYNTTFRLLFPKDYDAAASTNYPMVVMLHGAGESALGNDRFGKYPNGDPRRYNNDHQLLHHGKTYLQSVENGKWPGFVMFPQNIYGDWTNAAWILADVVEIIEALCKTHKIDRNRIIIAGLSGGANGVWDCLKRYPTVFAAGIPYSGIGSPTEDNTTKVVPIPIWYFQGEVDPNPSKAHADRTIRALRNAGGTPIYTVYLETGHGTWNKAIAEKDFFPFMLRSSKLTIKAYFGKTEYDEKEVVNSRLTISPGFAGYEWRKNGVLIPGANTHEITATSLGSYTVRFRRGATDWTEWSEPLILKLKSFPVIFTHPSSATLTAGRSVTFSVTASGTAPLSYQWQKDGVNIAGATSSTYTINNVLAANDGQYRVIVSNALGTATSNYAKLTVKAALAASIDAPEAEALYKGGQTIEYIGSGMSSQGTPLPESAFYWKLEFHRPNGITAVWTRSGSKSGTFTIPTTGETSINVFYRLILTVKSGGSSKTVTRDILPETTEIVIKTQPEGLKVKVDGVVVSSTHVFDAVEGRVRTLGVVTPQTLNGKTYKFSHWSQGGTATHTFTIPDNDVIYTAVFTTSTTSEAREGIAEALDTKNNIRLYPNPSVNNITLNLESNLGEDVNVIIINSVGKILKTSSLKANTNGVNSMDFDVSDIPNGSYTLKVQKGSQVYYKHFIISK